jgi:hypothetical protein
MRKLMASALIAAAALLAGCSGSQAHHVDLQYNPDGVQMTCTHAELGWTATVHGDGAPFAARCDSDGRIDVWDATS